MPTTALTWFPPAPAPGPASLLQLPPDDWALEPKIDGIRVIVLAGEPYTRNGQILNPSKGVARLREIVKDIPETLDGEWVMASGTFHLFDLPDHEGDYDTRQLVVQELVARVADPAFVFVHSFATTFRFVYESLRTSGVEGVVLKRRSSLYVKQTRPSSETRDWLKRRFAWDNQGGTP